MQSGKGGEMRSYRRARRCWGSKEETEKRLGFLKRRGTQSMKGENVNKGWSRQREQGAGYQVAAAEYKEQDKEVKKKCRYDKSQYILRKTVEVEDAGRRGDSKTLYWLVKELSGATDTFIEKDGWTYDKVTRGRNQKMERALRGSAELRRSGNMLRGPGRLREYRGAGNRQRRCEQRGDTACNQEPEDREGGRK